MHTIKLTPPTLLSENINQHITCIRPKRVGGPRIAHEQWKDKTIIHNYGHGGFGWTLLPGSVLHAFKLLEEAITKNPSLQYQKKITVIGAGCMGLLTAILLHNRGWQVTIVAEQITTLTSHKAAGSASVIAIKASKENQPLMNQIAVNSYLFYQEAIRSNNPLFTGVKQLPVYMIHEGTPNYQYPMINAGIMEEPEEVMLDFGAATYKAKKFDTFFIETTIVMQTFMDAIKEHNILLIQKKVTDFSELSDHIIFNCSGLGARAWDKELIVPVQGHLVMMQNQPLEELQYILYAHIKIEGKVREISWTPKNGGMLGGSAFNFQDKLETNPTESSAIIERAKIFFGNYQFSSRS